MDYLLLIRNIWTIKLFMTATAADGTHPVTRLKRHTWCKITRGFIPRKIHVTYIQAGGH